MSVRVLLGRLALLLAMLALAEGRVAAKDLDILLFGNLDAGRAAFLSTGAKIGLDSLDREGPQGLLTIGEGTRRERRPCGCGAVQSVTRVSPEASAQIGYQWSLPGGVVAAFAGIESGYGGLSHHPRTGLRAQVETWLRPSDDTLVQAVLIGGTARGSVWTRLAWGYRLWDAYLGPEVSAFIDATRYRKAALGLHATDFALKGVHLRVSSGMEWETSHTRPAPYATLTTWVPF